MAAYTKGVTHAGVAVSNWSGAFDCSICRRKRLIAAEFSKKMLEKKRSDPGFQLKCKACVDAAQKAEQDKAATKTVGDDVKAVCSKCKVELSSSKFTKPQLKKGPDKQRCIDCVAAAQNDEAAQSDAKKLNDLAEAKKKLALAEKSGTVAEQLGAASRLAALEGELVTGIKPKTHHHHRGGRSSSRGRRGGRGKTPIDLCN